MRIHPLVIDQGSQSLSRISFTPGGEWDKGAAAQASDYYGERERSNQHEAGQVRVSGHLLLSHRQEETGGRAGHTAEEISGQS